jgi:hypothetical protein
MMSRAPTQRPPPGRFAWSYPRGGADTYQARLRSHFQYIIIPSNPLATPRKRGAWDSTASHPGTLHSSEIPEEIYWTAVRSSEEAAAAVPGAPRS